jgi:hypothetical protein
MIESIKQRRFGRRTLLTVVLSLALIAVIAPSAANALLAAEPDEAAPGDMEFYFESYAKEYSVSMKEAERRSVRSDELKALLLKIVAAEDGRIAGWGLVHEPQFGGWVYLAGDAPPTAATAAIQRQNADVYIQLGADYTLAELKDAMKQRSTWEAIPESMRDRLAWTDIDVRANSLVVAIDRDIPPAKRRTGGLADVDAIEELPLDQASAALEVLLEGSTGLPFTVVLDSRGMDDSIYGGEHIHNQDGGSCTSGFAVVKNGTRGMLTAGHCGNPFTHYGSRTLSHTGGGTSAFAQDVVSGNSGDTRWYTTSQWESDNFYYSTSTNRDLTATEDRANMFGRFVCHFGTNSGQSCGTVVSTSFDPHMSACWPGWLGGCDDKWVKVEGTFLVRCEGDSGGPWYKGSVGYGTHSTGGGDNSCTIGGTDWAAFFAIDDIEDVLGVTVVAY